MEKPPPLFFSSVAELRTWFAAHHDRVNEVWIGYFKRDSGRPGVTYSQAVEEALCFGWIDGLLRPLDTLRYANRYTPRRPGSIWSRRNIQRVEALSAAGRMTSAGLRAFAQRQPGRSGLYSFEAPRPFDAKHRTEFRRHRAAWAYYASQPAHYRRQTAHWVMSAKEPATRERRLRQLIDDSAAGRWIKGAQSGHRPPADLHPTNSPHSGLTVPPRQR